LAAVLAIWGAILLTGGLTTVLDSRRGETREAVTDPSAAGFEAFVEQTWSMLVATEDASGDLVQVAVVAARPLGRRGVGAAAPGGDPDARRRDGVRM